MEAQQRIINPEFSREATKASNSVVTPPLSCCRIRSMSSSPMEYSVDKASTIIAPCGLTKLVFPLLLSKTRRPSSQERKCSASDSRKLSESFDRPTEVNDCSGCLQGHRRFEIGNYLFGSPHDATNRGIVAKPSRPHILKVGQGENGVRHPTSLPIAPRRRQVRT